MKKRYNIITDNKILKIMITFFLIAAILCYFAFIQYENIIYNNKVNSIKTDIKELTIKVNELKDKEDLLETNVNTTNSQLEVLKTTLSTLQNDLKVATDKLNSL
jgi:septal ring factor EnvC (AmiA/AmiB activator)